MREPAVSRPDMPSYGVDDADDSRRLPWSWAEERLHAAKRYWVATVTRAGAPHLMPVWALWSDVGLLFSTGATSKKARNLARNAACTVSLEAGEGGAEAVVVEGVAELVGTAELPEGTIAAYEEKYAFSMEGYNDPWYLVRPRRAFGFIDGQGDFAATATRWDFEETQPSRPS